MPTFRERNAEVQAIKYTGDNYKVIETWGTAFGVPVCEFLTDPGVPCVGISDSPGEWYWLQMREGEYLVKRAGDPPVIMDSTWFEDLYQEVSQ